MPFLNKAILSSHYQMYHYLWYKLADSNQITAFCFAGFKHGCCTRNGLVLGSTYIVQSSVWSCIN